MNRVSGGIGAITPGSTRRRGHAERTPGVEVGQGWRLLQSRRVSFGKARSERAYKLTCVHGYGPQPTASSTVRSSGSANSWPRARSLDSHKSLDVIAFSAGAHTAVGGTQLARVIYQRVCAGVANIGDAHRSAVFGA